MSLFTPNLESYNSNLSFDELEDGFQIVFGSKSKSKSKVNITLKQDSVNIKKIKSKVNITLKQDSVNIKKYKHFRHKINKKTSKPIYDEMDNLPKDFVDAIDKKQNLTLRQILVLMNLHAMPGLVLNSIHDNLQLKVKKRQVKITHDSRIFYVSYYNWADLLQIEKMIDTMLFEY
jgi:hypothetical protein